MKAEQLQIVMFPIEQTEKGSALQCANRRV